MCKTLLCACGDTQKTPDSHAVADLVLTNGNVITVDEQNPSAKSVAKIGDRIAAVGNAAHIAAYIGDTCKAQKLYRGFIREWTRHEPEL
jgi:hypothetical protein